MVNKNESGALVFAVDMGTTTIDARLYRGNSSFHRVCCTNIAGTAAVAHAASPNPQSLYGKDIVSRINAAVQNARAKDALTSLLREKVCAIIAEMASKTTGTVESGVLVGNTAMLHFWCALDVRGLASAPFTAASLFGETLTGGKYPAYLPPCLGPFLGADLVAAVVHLWRAQTPAVQPAPFWLVDLGTNCEIAYFDGERLTAASVAAGPAFASALGPGSVLMAKVSDALGRGGIDQTGLLAGPESCGVTQKDVRNLQLAKGAVAAALEVLLSAVAPGHCGGDPESAPLYLCGAFGDAVGEEDARRIGLVPACLTGRITASGNGALDGAGDMALHKDAREAAERVAANAVTVDLGGNPAFEKAFLGALNFPD